MSEKESLTIEKTWIVNDATVIALTGCLTNGSGFDVIEYIDYQK
ncbi:MAG: hypothetical protein PHV05_03555 [Candidatus Riflebacteria bacterium]|jgi:hypothetical protein|nr:hypothetical protein [Candidatus Riflebacteria bacterium]